jgi:hypothetical protein
MKAGQGRKRQEQEHKANLAVGMAEREETAQRQAFPIQNVSGLSPQEMFHTTLILPNGLPAYGGAPLHGNLAGIQNQVLSHFMQNTSMPAETVYGQQVGVQGNIQSPMNHGAHSFGMPDGIQSTNQSRRYTWTISQPAHEVEPSDQVSRNNPSSTDHEQWEWKRHTAF